MAQTYNVQINRFNGVDYDVLLPMTPTRAARFTVGTTAGWTSADCDYLCDGTADQTEINAAITALPATGWRDCNLRWALTILQQRLMSLKIMLA